MTPAEKLGYKVGDWFEMLKSREGFEAGQMVVLFQDDGTSMPLFQGRNFEYNIADGKQGAYTALRSVKPLNQQQETTMQTTLILKKDGNPFATKGSATQRMNALSLQDTHTVMVYGNGYAIFANALNEDPVTLQPGDYIKTDGLSESEYHQAAAGFIAAGCSEGGYTSQAWSCEALGWWKGSQGLLFGDAQDFKRQLTLAQVLSATNGGGVADGGAAVAAGQPGTMIKDETTMHLTDLLYQARQERDEAQARYERALADHRATYPWLVVEERSDTTAIDLPPEEWRAGDVVECVDSKPEHCTEGKQYIVNEDPFRYGIGNIRLVSDDDGDVGMPPSSSFRFIRRP